MRGTSCAFLGADNFNVRRYMGASHFNDPFVKGAWYRVRIAFKSPLGRGGELVPVGSMLRYVGCTYGRYDNSSGFDFAAQGGNSLRWDVHDDDNAIPAWDQCFERVMTAPNQSSEPTQSSVTSPAGQEPRLP